ncbi:hypothetical protein [Ensifer sp.]|uniref:hypothetical protein n=1 Tax=Ensifer sp. TaxID=1872086 RepID=UPI00289ECB19|nr:hypothetical protein [Ensifer sp.]
MTMHIKYEKEALLRGWDAVYDLEEFILAYSLAPLAAREIFAKAGPRRLDLANAMDVQKLAMVQRSIITRL